jgi:hypothetical protein
LTKTAIDKHKGKRTIRPNTATKISNPLLVILYDLLKNAAAILKIPPPNKRKLGGSGTRDMCVGPPAKAALGSIVIPVKIRNEIKMMIFFMLFYIWIFLGFFSGRGCFFPRPTTTTLVPP